MPPHIASYLWDVPLDKLNLVKASKFVIERVLEYGNTEDVVWLEKTYGKELIIKTISESLRISAKTGNYFALRYKLDDSVLTCLRAPYIQKQHRF